MPRTTRRVAALVAGVVLLGACAPASGDAPPLEISGSSTVAPITEAIARQGGFEVSVVSEGTQDGFARFCAGETPITNASSPIPGPGQPVDYLGQCRQQGVEFIELPIGLDALSVIRHEDNTFATELTLAELRMIWEPGSQVVTWADVRPDWPQEPIGLYGRPPGSGTLDVFTQVVTGQPGSIREDYRATDDLGELAAWIAQDPHALGFMGIGNYLSAPEGDRDRMANVAVDGVLPSLEAVRSGEYGALTRPLLLYVSVAALEEDPAVGEFVDYYLQEGQALLPRVYFYALPEEAYPLVRERFEDRVTGSLYEGDPFRPESVAELLN